MTQEEKKESGFSLESKGVKDMEVTRRDQSACIFGKPSEIEDVQEESRLILEPAVRLPSFAYHMDWLIPKFTLAAISHACESSRKDEITVRAAKKTCA